MLFKRLKELENINGNGTQLISIYIPNKKKIYDVRSYVMEEYSKVENIKSNITRKNVQTALSSISSMLSAYKETPENGLVLFFGVDAKDDFHQMIFEPPESVKTFYYICDKKFFLEPMFKAIETHDIYGILVFDLGEATIGYLKGTSIESYSHFESLVPNKHNHGGQSSLRFERLRDDAINEYYKKIADQCSMAFLDRDLKGVIIGGPAMTKDFFLKEEKLHYQIRNMIVATVNTTYTDESGLKEAVDAAVPMIQNLEYGRQKDIIDKFFGQLRMDEGGLCVYGNETVFALNSGKIETLLLSEDTNVDDIERLTKIAENFGSAVEIISERSEIGKLFTKTFKIGAILRYK